MLELRVKAQTASRMAKGFPWSTVDVKMVHTIIESSKIINSDILDVKVSLWVCTEGEQGREFSTFLSVFESTYHISI